MNKMFCGLERIKDAQLIQKVNATALGFLLPIRFIDFSFPTSRNQKNKNNDAIFVRPQQR
ncbi:hypothetical protein EYA06_22840 [Salmonella enterica subsp. enterica serovar Montevideo]|uniref:Uncharacterized protein n=1 Tax=Salmonella montevideo TaxID=115981 RepID=A0A725S0I0_SALMO|nr:hypothetical protein [Salmonella enterica subsp. enterica serovar Sundsvall]ECG3921123.1 hypothetical protein [Salmonella enterica subsp. enterica serovar Montevideo]HAE0879129.1 hypothetical protein [Salmonella enterica subsp. enterica serovar Montevideo]